MKKAELLAPAKSLEVLKTAVRYGADAVYIGGEAFGLRAKAENFSREDMEEGIRFAHEHNVKVYVTANIIAHNADLSGAEQYFRELNEIRPDGILIADPGMFMLARENTSGIELHISTQANNTNYMTANFWHKEGAKRIVTARELSIKEIKEMRAKTDPDLDIETFVHGAMCISYSGRCLLSAYFTGREANLGLCTHPCRWKYALMEESRPGEYLPVYENERGTYIMNSRDLCMIEHIPDLLDAGVSSLKIEGRMKSTLYVATVVRAYRNALDDYYESPSLYEKNKQSYMEEIKKTTYRPFTTGFFYKKPDKDDQIYDNNTYVNGATYIGKAGKLSDSGEFEMIQKNKFSVGEVIEIMKPNGDNIETEVLSITGENGEEMSAPHAGEHLFVRLSIAPEEGDVLRRMEA